MKRMLASDRTSLEPLSTPSAHGNPDLRDKSVENDDNELIGKDSMALLRSGAELAPADLVGVHLRLIAAILVVFVHLYNYEEVPQWMQQAQLVPPDAGPNKKWVSLMNAAPPNLLGRLLPTIPILNIFYVLLGHPIIHAPPRIALARLRAAMIINVVLIYTMLYSGFTQVLAHFVSSSKGSQPDNVLDLRSYEATVWSIATPSSPATRPGRCRCRRCRRTFEAM